MNFLRQSTSVDVGIGPFVDSSDGVTAETALTITQPDIRIKKNGGAWAQKNAAQTLSHEENGWYEVTLDATDTNTVGILIVAVNESGALPVWREFQVIEEAVYDRDYAASATGIVGTAQTGDAFARLGAPAGASVSADIAGVQSDTNDIQTRIPAALVSGRIDASVGAMAANVMTAAAAAADLTTELQSGLATAANLATLDGKVDVIDNFLDTEMAAVLSAVDTEVAAIKAVTDLLPDAGALTSLATAVAVADLPTNAELATALGTADDAVLAQVALVKAKTDSLTFTNAGVVDANITHVISDPVQTNGAADTEWGGAP